ncbi:MAG TPA: glucose-1-phosphate adenylyltransferase [Opitutales bacterium]|nr:glucose-1-phosphate adenylyltransferase [Opitutales bacterium]
MSPRVISIIMGGGRGSRLHPLTKDRCKPAVPLGGNYRLVDIPISNCIHSGYNQIYLLTQFNTASLHRHIQSAYQFDPFDQGFVDILSAEQTHSSEQWYQGTADAVRQNMHHFHGADDDLFLILSGDQLYRMDFREIVTQHLQTKADITIAAKAMPKECVHGLGVMRVAEDLAITEFVEKPTDPKVVNSLVVGAGVRSRIKQAKPGQDYCLASMGIYVFTGKVLKEAMQTSAMDFGKEIIPGLLGKKKLSSFVFDNYWEDIGTVGAFFEANLELTKENPPFDLYDHGHPIFTHLNYLPPPKLYNCATNNTIIAGGCVVHAKKISHAIIGVRSRVGDGTVLENVVMMGSDQFESERERARDRERQVPEIGVGKNCDIRQAIIDKNARIGDNVKLSPEGKPDMWQQGDLFVRDGVIIVTKNGVVPSGTVV